MPGRRFLSILAAGVLCSAAAARADQFFDVKQVAPGVYAAIARQTFRTNANAVFVVLDNSVLVVDTEAEPAAASELIRTIKQVTGKPVQNIVITHFHADHAQGATTYLKTWPQADLISSDAARASILLRAQARMKFEAYNVPHQIDGLKATLAKTTDPVEKKNVQTQLDQATVYQQELSDMQLSPPTITVDKGLRIDDGTHPVQILFLGKAHTDGDLFVYLPKDRILITGDSIQSLTPTMRDCYPLDWPKTLKNAEQLDFDLVIGGHGEPFHGKATFALWEEYFTDLLNRAARAYASGETLDQARKELAPALVATYGNRFPPRFPSTVISNIERAYRFEGGEVQ